MAALCSRLSKFAAEALRRSQRSVTNRAVRVVTPFVVVALVAVGMPAASFAEATVSLARPSGPGLFTDLRAATTDGPITSLDYQNCGGAPPTPAPPTPAPPHPGNPYQPVMVSRRGAWVASPAITFKPCPYKLDWTMPDRLTEEAAKYPRTDYLYPQAGWRANVFIISEQGTAVTTACGTDTVWRWTITARPANSAKAKLVDAMGCKVTLTTPTLGTFTVRGSLSKASDPKHVELTSATGKILVKDLLIAAVGDSNGSGEGNGPFFDYQCNRSFKSYQFRTAQAIEKADRRTSVTLVWTSCSGARIEHLTTRKYPGVHPAFGPALPPQVAQVSDALTFPVRPYAPRAGRTPRKVDVVLTSVGVNDLSFGSVLEFCIKGSLRSSPGLRQMVPSLQCENRRVKETKDINGDTSFSGSSSSKDPTLDAVVRGRIDGLKRGYLSYQRSLASELAVPPSQVILTEYPDFATNDHQELCGTRAGDYLIHPFPALAKNEWAWLQTMGDLLNGAVARSGFTHVTGLSQQFLGRGYCAVGSLIVPLPKALFFVQTEGAFHPNEQGHGISESANLPFACRALFGNANCRSKQP